MLIADNLHKSFGKREVVRGVSMEVEPGNVVGLLGPNGAGKTTCFYMIVGLVAVGKGTIHVDDTDITHQPVNVRSALGVGYLPQDASIFRKLTVEQNIMSILEISGELMPKPAATASSSYWKTSELRTSASSRASACPAVNAGAPKSPVHWPPAPVTSCWMNLSQASIRYPSSRSRKLSNTSPSWASVFSSPTTMCAKRSASAIMRIY